HCPVRLIRRSRRCHLALEDPSRLSAAHPKESSKYIVGLRSNMDRPPCMRCCGLGRNEEELGVDDRGQTVMVIDDDESVRSSLARLLRSAGLDFEVFASAESFLAVAAPDRAGCLIIDVQMPGMRGLELQARCRQQLALVPGIMITAFRDQDAERRSLAIGAIAFIQKPFDASGLLELIITALDRANQ